MRRNAFFTLGLAALMGTACQDKSSDLYDVEFANQKKQLEYAENFPVENIDPNQDWNLFTTTSVQVTVNEDWGETYTVKIYTANPLDETSGALLLAKGDVVSGNTFTASVNVPKSLSGVYIARVNKNNEIMVRYAALAGSNIAITFGEDTDQTRALTLNTYIQIDTQSAPFTQSEVDEMVEQATPMSEATSFEDGGYYKYTEDGDYNGSSYWAGANMTFIITNGATIQASPGKAPNSGTTLIVDNGTLVVDGNDSNFGNSKKLIIMPGGTVEFKGNQSTLPDIYNAGTMKSQDGESSSGFYYGVFYNCGTVEVANLADKSWEGANGIVNQGHLVVTGEFNSKGGKIYNNCYMEVGSSSNLGYLTVGDGAHFKVDGTGYMGLGWDSDPAIRLGEKSYFEVGELKNNYGTIEAPANTSAMPYIKFGSVTGWNCPRPWSGYYVIDPGDYSSLDTTKGEKTKNTSYANFVNEALGEVYPGAEGWQSVPSYLIAIQSKFTFVEPDASSCKGTITYTKEEEKDDPFYVFYAFEDLGYVGDYDFNDVILRVFTADENGDAEVQLVAAGGTLSVGVYYYKDSQATALWSDVHGTNGFNTEDVVNVGETTKSFLSTTIHIGTDNIYDLDLYIYVKDGENAGSSRQVSSRTEMGDYPKCLKIPAGWKWPLESVSIFEVYDTEDYSISNWAQSASSATGWYTNVTSGKEHKVLGVDDF